MVDRGSSLPPSNNAEEVHTMINPAYSGSVAASESVHFSNSREEMVEIIETEPRKPSETQSKKRIKYSRIVFSILILILAIFNIYHFVVWQSERPSNVERGESTNISDLEVMLDIAILSSPLNETEEALSSEMPSSTEIPSTTTTTESTTTSTEPPTTTLSHREQMRETYRNFTEWYYRPYSEIGLDNYVANAEYFSKGGAIFEETQFADLSVEQLRKLVNNGKDPKRGDTSKRCDIHTYYQNQRTESKVEGSNLYGSHDRIKSRVDLRRSGLIGAVRNQGTSCNAGYAFAVTNLLETKVETNGERLSVQMLLADDHNHHCEGGETFRAMESVQHSGIVTESVLPYDETEHWHDIDDNATRYDYAQACLITRSHREAISIKNPNYWNTYDTISASTVSSPTYIKHFLAKIGALVVEVPVDRSFFFYKSGSYSPDCDAIIGYQPALVVGYGMRNGMNIWILRNSFGTEWGIDGDFEMARDSDCGAFDYAFSFYKSV